MRRMKHSRVYAFLLLVVAPVAGFTKLGSPKPEVCQPENYDCPSHMVCIPRSSDGTLHCVCDRFLGFRGQECREHTRASWLLLVITIIITLWSFWALLSNITLAIELKDAGRLKANSIGRTLLFNSLSTLPVMALAIGFALTVLVVDPHMEFYEHGRDKCMASIYFFYFLTTLSVSVVWMIDVRKMASVGLGIESIRVKKRQERVYLTATYVISLSSAVLIVIFFAISSLAIQMISVIGIVYNIFVAGSYCYAGRRVVQDLRVAEASATMRRQMEITQIAQNIRNTSQAMTRLTLGMSVGFIGVGLTIPTSSPSIQGQNSLPRVLQGQVFYFMTQACALGVNQLIVEYMQYGSSKRHLKPQSAVMSIVGWLLCRPSAKYPYSLRTVVPDQHNAGGASERKGAHLRSDRRSSGLWSWVWGRSFASDGRSFLTSVEKAPTYYNLYGTDSENQRIVKVAVDLGESGDGTVRPQLSSVSSAGARQYMPMMIATLHTEGDDDGGDTLLSVETSEPMPWVRGKTVMSIGGDVVVNLEAGNMAKEELEVPSKGSHAFVRCYGENHLRCTWHTFEFGFAGGHELLANRSTVLMEGEVEVDENGFVTRWLHKSGVNTAPLLRLMELNMPPRWVVRCLGFPLSATWLTVAAPEVNALAEHVKASLVSEGNLIRLDCSTQSNTPTVIHALAASGVQQPSIVTPPSRSAILALKYLPSRVFTSAPRSPRSVNSSKSGAISSLSLGSGSAKELVVDPNCSDASRADTRSRGHIRACVVPLKSVPTNDSWIMKVNDSRLWKNCPVQACVVMLRQCLASPHFITSPMIYKPERPSVNFNRVSPARNARQGRLGGSDSIASEESGFGNATNTSKGTTEEARHDEGNPATNTTAVSSQKSLPPLRFTQESRHKLPLPRPTHLSGVCVIEESEAEDDEERGFVASVITRQTNTSGSEANM